MTICNQSDNFTLVCLVKLIRKLSEMGLCRGQWPLLYAKGRLYIPKRKTQERKSAVSAVILPSASRMCIRKRIPEMKS